LLDPTLSGCETFLRLRKAGLQFLRLDPHFYSPRERGLGSFDRGVDLLLVHERRMPLAWRRHIHMKQEESGTRRPVPLG
jgi:hypothetical protein